MMTVSDDEEAVAKNLARFATSPDFITYPETYEAKLIKKSLQKFGPMFVSLQQLKPDLTWPQSSMKRIMIRVAEIQTSAMKWQRALSREELDEYSTRMSKRVRTAIRHIKQSQAKKVAWACEILEPKDCGDGLDHRGVRDDEEDNEGGEEEFNEEPDEETAAEDDQDDDADEAPLQTTQGMKRPAAAPAQTSESPMKRPAAHEKTSQEAFYFGYDFELDKAWRQKCAGGGKREFAPVEYEDTDDAASHPRARFSDGSTRDVPQVTVGELREKNNLKLSARGVYWEGATPDGERLWVSRTLAARAVDRCLPKP